LGHNGVYVRPLLAKRFIEGRAIVAVVDFIKMGGLIGSRLMSKKGFVAVIFRS
jgi:hypothetical protein